MFYSLLKLSYLCITDINKLDLLTKTHEQRITVSAINDIIYETAEKWNTLSLRPVSVKQPFCKINKSDAWYKCSLERVCLISNGV